MFNPAETHELIPLLANITVGSVGLFGLMWLNVFFLRRIALSYEIHARVNLNKDRYDRVFVNYFVSIVLLMLVQILSILIWGIVLKGLNLVSDISSAILFAGSCYTTIGIVSDVMPVDWKLMAILIALSGLFSMAFTTATMLNMGPTFRLAWLRKHSKRIQQIMDKAQVSIPELSSAFVKHDSANSGANTTSPHTP